MSEEKMRNNQWQQAGWIADWILRHNLTAAIANSATAFVELQDHLAALQESEAGAVEPWKDDSVVWRLSQEFNKPAPWFDERMSSVAYHAAFEFNPGDAGSRNCFMAGARWMSGFLELVLDSSKELEANALTGSGLDGYAKELLQFHDEIEESEYTTLDVQELNALTRLGWLDKTGLCAWELTDEGRYVVGIMDELRRMASESIGNDLEGEKR